MSFKDCIQKQLGDFQAEGFVTPKQAEELFSEYEGLVEKYTQTMGDLVAAEAQAAKVVEIKQARLVQEAKSNKRAAVVQEQVLKRLQGQVEEKKSALQKMNVAEQKLHRTPSLHHEVGDLYESVATRQKTIARTEMVKLIDFFQEYGSKWLGFVQNHRGIPEVIRGMMGEDVPNSMARVSGEKMREVFDNLHFRYKQAGGIIGELPNYFPQTHNPVKLRNVEVDEWINHLMQDGVLDRQNMIDLDTGLPMTDERLIQQMRDDYEGITTHGLNEIAERVSEGKTTRGLGRDVLKRRQQSRFYRFKDADAFLEYNRKFGYGEEGLFDAIGGHIQAMSRDIALMELLGPKPNATARYLDLAMEAQGVNQNGRNFVNGMYALQSGRLSDYGTLPMFYRVVEGSKAVSRNLLGGAALSATADSAFIAGSLRMSGFRSWSALKTYFNGINPLSKVNQRAMQRYTAVQTGLLGMSLDSARFTDGISTDGGKVVQSLGFMTSMIMRASGLTRITDQAKMATMSAVSSEMAEHATTNISYARLPAKQREIFKRFNIGEEEFKIIKRSTPYKDPETGGTFITGEGILEVPNVPRDKLLRIASDYEDMVTRMGETATNEPTLRTRAVTTGAALAPDNAKVGSSYRAVMSALMTFKGFPITVMQNFTFPLARRAASGNIDDVMDASLVFGSGLVLGAAVLQAKMLSRGEETRDMDDPKFLLAAAMQAGGLGIFGDFLFQDMSRFNQSYAQTLAGPVVGMYSDGLKIINANFNRAIDDRQESKFAAESFNFVSRYIPASTLWYARLPVERFILNSIEKTLDPKYDQKVRRREKQMQRDEGRGYWWRP